MAGPSDHVDVLVVGEAPGAQEDEAGSAFVGESGKLLRSVLPRCSVGFTNTVRCRPPDNREPTDQEIHCCSVFLDEEVLRLKPRVIVGVGGVATSLIRPALPPSMTISRIHGVWMPTTIAGFSAWFMPSLHPSFVLRNGGVKSQFFGLFRNDLQSISNYAKAPPPKIWDMKSARIITPARGDEITALAKLKIPYSVDIETVGLLPTQESAAWLSVAFSDGATTIVFPLAHPGDDRGALIPQVLEFLREKPWVAHNALFEYSWFRHYGGFDWVPKYFHDTMILSHLHFRRNTVLKLEALTRVLLGVNVKSATSVDVRRLVDYPLSDVLQYNALDALAEHLCFDKIFQESRREVYSILIGAVRSTAEMQARGLHLDLDNARALDSALSAQMAAVEQEISGLYEVRKYREDTGKEFLVSSNDALGYVLAKIVGGIDLPKTRTGKPQVDESTLIAIDESVTPLPALVLSWRERAKLLSTYVRPVVSGALIHPDGFLHPSYSVGRTHTLRLSSDTPNIQNFPKRQHKEVRGMVRAPPGHLLVAADSGQIEARIVAMASGDRRLCGEFLNHVDVHKHWSIRAIELDPDIVMRAGSDLEQDYAAQVKATRNKIIKGGFVFASLYAARPETVRAQTGFSEAANSQMLNEFWDAYSGVRKWQFDRRREYAQTGGVTTMFGVRRYGVMEGNEPINTPVQGTMALMILAAQNALWGLAHEYKDPYLVPRINIHDDLTFILPDTSDIDAYIEVIAEEMVRARWPWVSLPLTVEISVGTHWDNLEEVFVKEGAYNR